MYKRIFFLLGAFALVLGGCSSTGDNAINADSGNEVESVAVSEDKKKVTVTTSFLQDMVKELAGDIVDVQLIIPAGEDPHMYVAKPEDLLKLQDANLILYHGLHFEGKMIEALEKNNGIAVSKNFASEEISRMDEDGHEMMDPHFWFDIKLYKKATQEASQALITLVPDEKEVIEEKTLAYQAELDALDKENESLIKQIPEENRYLITPHDAFNYFARAYNIPVHAPQGVSTDGEVANKDIDATVDFIVEHKVKAIFAESTTDPARMDKLQQAVKAKGFEVKVVKGEGNELFSDSLAPEGQTGDTYLTMYRHNVKLITENLK